MPPILFLWYQTPAMRRAANKLLFGRGKAPGAVHHSTLRKRWENLEHIWNNTYEEDAGLEKVVRLLLALSQFLFPGLYLKHLFWRNGPLVQDLATDVYVLLKAGFPIMVLWQGWWHSDLVLGLNLWLTAETLLYIPHDDLRQRLLPSPRSYRRSKLLIFINYLEVVFTFAVLHMAGQYFNQPLTTWTDSVYLSFVITSTIGFGEFFPVTGMGKLIISVQSLFYLSYIALFISFFNQGITSGYFQRLNK
ncbi:MAG: two pore domain potassium channel family protein [Flavobacteriales bacterium]|nr:two pore domain potassium channel family protein [Flavobacteriales bacterium]